MQVWSSHARSLFSSNEQFPFLSKFFTFDPHARFIFMLLEEIVEILFVEAIKNRWWVSCTALSPPRGSGTLVHRKHTWPRHFHFLRVIKDLVFFCYSKVVCMHSCTRERKKISCLISAKVIFCLLTCPPCILAFPGCRTFAKTWVVVIIHVRRNLRYKATSPNISWAFVVNDTTH